MGLDEHHDTAAAELFQRSWISYQNVLKGDYLEHKSLYAGVQSTIAGQRRRANRPLRFLDLGCGDADYICRSFADLRASDACYHDLLSLYQGVDLSQPALEVAKVNLQKAADSNSVSLECNNFLTWINDHAQQGESYDVLLMSFALHHLDVEAKQELMNAAYKLLAPTQGVMILVDTFRRPGESMPVYLTRFLEDVDTNWVLLGDQGKQDFRDHISKCDLPECVDTYKQLAMSAGFSATHVLHEASKDVAKLLVFTTTSTDTTDTTPAQQ